MKALQALRGINVMSSVVLVAELGDIARFSTAPQLMGYVGLVPSERSSGATRQQGRITRTGNCHARRILVEAAWAYRFRHAARTVPIRRRDADLSPEVRRVAWKAQVRLCRRYARLSARGMNKNRTVIAIARELAGFVWAIAREPNLLAA